MNNHNQDHDITEVLSNLLLKICELWQQELQVSATEAEEQQPKKHSSFQGNCGRLFIVRLEEFVIQVILDHDFCLYQIVNKIVRSSCHMNLRIKSNNEIDLDSSCKIFSWSCYSSETEKFPNSKIVATKAYT